MSDYARIIVELTPALAGSDVVVYVPSLTYSLTGRVTELENLLTAIKDR